MVLDSVNKYLLIIMVMGYMDKFKVFEVINVGVNEYFVKFVCLVDLFYCIFVLIECFCCFVKVVIYFGLDCCCCQDLCYNGFWCCLIDEEWVEVSQVGLMC